jgi:SAM-dependent methyltransferase
MPNPYPGRFESLVEEAWTHALDGARLPMILDLGSGGRSQPGIQSMDYTAHPSNSLQGDCLNLPFKDSSVDLILSQAVLEHVTEPQRAVDEMRRVLRPGGILYTEVAFMQPVHMNPHHYFNVTPNGLRWLLRDWEILEEGIVGLAYETVNKILQAFGRKPIPPFVVPNDKYWWAASGVSSLARCPV